MTDNDSSRPFTPTQPLTDPFQTASLLALTTSSQPHSRTTSALKHTEFTSYTTVKTLSSTNVGDLSLSAKLKSARTLPTVIAGSGRIASAPSTKGRSRPSTSPFESSRLYEESREDESEEGEFMIDDYIDDETVTEEDNNVIALVKPKKKTVKKKAVQVDEMPVRKTDEAQVQRAIRKAKERLQEYSKLNQPPKEITETKLKKPTAFSGRKIATVKRADNNFESAHGVMDERQRRELNKLAIVNKILQEEEERRQKLKQSPHKISHTSLEDNEYQSRRTTALSSKGRRRHLISEESSPHPLRKYEESDDEIMDVNVDSFHAPVYDDRIWKKKEVQKEADNTGNKSMSASCESLVDNFNSTQLHRNRNRISELSDEKSDEKKPFTCQPNRLIFKDYVPGKNYKKKVVLTNVSSRVNTFQLLPLPLDLQGYFTVTFSPPGHLSAGLTCPIYITFHPPPGMHADLKEIPIKFSAESGPSFHFNIDCLTPKCEPAISYHEDQSTINDPALRKTVRPIQVETDMQKVSVLEALRDATDRIDIETAHLYFGKCPIGETNKRMLEVINTGFVGAGFTVYPVRSHFIPAHGEANENNGQSDYIETYFDFESSAASALSASSMSSMQSSRSLERAEDFIYGYSTVAQHIQFRPVQEGGTYRTEFLIAFRNPNISDNAHSATRFVSKIVCEITVTDLPLYMQEPEMDFGWLRANNIYREKLEIHNRNSTAHRFQLKLVECSRVNIDDDENLAQAEKLTVDYFDKKHEGFEIERVNDPENMASFGQFDISPDIGFAQPGEPFFAWIRFIPCAELIGYAFRLKLLLYIHKLSVPYVFQLCGRVARTDILFKPSKLNFGTISLFDSVKLPLDIHSQSHLISHVGCVQPPTSIDIQPSFGVVKLPPRGKVTLNVVFSPDKPGQVTFPLNFKTVDGKKYSIACSANVTQPPLVFAPSTGNFIDFQKISIGSFASATLVLTYPYERTGKMDHLKPCQYEIAVPYLNIGKNGEIQWTFKKPAQDAVSMMEIYPRVGTIKPGGNICVHVTVRPDWCHIYPQKKSVEPASVASRVRTKITREDRTSSAIKSGSNSTLNKEESSVKDHQVKEPVLEPVVLSEEMKKFTGQTFQWTIPCVIHPEGSSKSKDHVIFMQVRAAIIPPSLALVNTPYNRLDFGLTPLNEKTVKYISFKNLSTTSISLYSTLVDPFGPFSVSLPPELIQPGEVAKASVSFHPSRVDTYFESITISTTDKTSTLVVKLMGVAMKPNILIEPSDKKVWIGDVFLGESVTKSFRVHNTSMFPISCRIVLKEPSRVPVITQTKLGEEVEGRGVFQCTPRELTIQPACKSDVFVTFKPNAEGDDYWCDVEVHVDGNKEVMVVRVFAKCWATGMQISGYTIETKNDTLAQDGDSNEMTVEAALGKYVARYTKKSGMKGRTGTGERSETAKTDNATNDGSAEAYFMTTLQNEAKKKTMLDAVDLNHPLLSMLSTSTYNASSSNFVPCQKMKRLQFANVYCNWRQGGDGNWLLDIPDLIISNAKPYGVQALTGSSLPTTVSSLIKSFDGKKNGSGTGEFVFEAVSDYNTLGQEAYRWFLSTSRTKPAQGMEANHNFKFHIEPLKGTLELGSQRVLKLQLIDADHERPTGSREKDNVNNTASSLGIKSSADIRSSMSDSLGPASNGENNDTHGEVVNKVQVTDGKAPSASVPLHVAAYYKLTLKGGVSVVPVVEKNNDSFETSYTATTTSIQPNGTLSCQSTGQLVQQAVAASNERIWIIRFQTRLQQDK